MHVSDLKEVPTFKTRTRRNMQQVRDMRLWLSCLLGVCKVPKICLEARWGARNFLTLWAVRSASRTRGVPTSRRSILDRGF